MLMLAGSRCAIGSAPYGAASWLNLAETWHDLVRALVARRRRDTRSYDLSIPPVPRLKGTCAAWSAYQARKLGIGAIREQRAPPIRYSGNTLYACEPPPICREGAIEPPPTACRPEPTSRATQSRSSQQPCVRITFCSRLPAGRECAGMPNTPRNPAGKPLPFCPP